MDGMVIIGLRRALSVSRRPYVKDGESKITSTHRQCKE